jgi:hypothetical protein
MRMSLPSQRIVPIILLGVLAAAFMAIVAGRLGGGGEEGTETNAQQVVERAFSPQSFKSGRFDATAQVSLEGAPSAESFAVNMKGSFDNDPAPPKGDVDVSFVGLGRTIDFGFVTTGKGGFVTLGNRAYEVPQSRLERERGGAGAGQEKSTFAALGLDPQSWLQNPTHVGTEDVGGVETDHVTAQVDAGKMMDDLFDVASRQRLPGASAQERQEIKSSLKGATADLYVAKEDGTLRKMAAQVQVAAPEGAAEAPIGKGTIAFSMQFTDVNEPQRITAPDNALPFSQFEPAFNARVLEAFTQGGGGEGSAQRGSGGGSSPSGGGGSTGAEPTTPAPALPDSAQKYLDCVEKAGSTAEVQQCVPLLD